MAPAQRSKVSRMGLRPKRKGGVRSLQSPSHKPVCCSSSVCQSFMPQRETMSRELAKRACTDARPCGRDGAHDDLSPERRGDEWVGMVPGGLDGCGDGGSPEDGVDDGQGGVEPTSRGQRDKVEEDREKDVDGCVVDPRCRADELLEGESEEEVYGKRASPTLSIPHASLVRVCGGMEEDSSGHQREGGHQEEPRSFDVCLQASIPSCPSLCPAYHQEETGKIGSIRELTSCSADIGPVGDADAGSMQGGCERIREEARVNDRCRDDLGQPCDLSYKRQDSHGLIVLNIQKKKVTRIIIPSPKPSGLGSTYSLKCLFHPRITQSGKWCLRADIAEMDQDLYPLENKKKDPLWDKKECSTTVFACRPRPYY
jgi:hypothetical protein